MVDDKMFGMLYGSFIGDSLALGVHWVYSTAHIKKKVGHITKYIDPINSYHPTKSRGEQTHYGDLAFFLMEFTKKNPNFTEKELSDEWYLFISNYNGYMDHASKRARQSYIKKNIPCGRKSIPDFAGSSRIAGLLFNYKDKDIYYIKDKVKIQTRLTHNISMSMETSDFLVDSIMRVLKGEKPSMVIDDIYSQNTYPEIREILEFGIEMDLEPFDAIEELGANCYVDGALQTCVYIIRKYEEDMDRALCINAELGGDSAGRGLYLGMILGAYHGYNKLNKKWIEELVLCPKLNKLTGINN